MNQEDFVVVSTRMTKDIMERVQLVFDMGCKEHGVTETKAIFAGSLGMAVGSMLSTLALDLDDLHHRAALLESFEKLYKGTIKEHTREYGTRIEIMQ